MKKWTCAFILGLAGVIPTVITRIVSMADMIGGSQGNSELLGYEVYGGVYFLKHSRRTSENFYRNSRRNDKLLCEYNDRETTRVA